MKKDKALFVQKTLEHYFPNPEIPLKHKDPYTLLIAVVLSAQCTDARVNLVTPALFAEAETPEKMVALGVEKIKSLIAPCGLSNTKAIALWTLSAQLLQRHRGVVPQTFEELESLRGVGHKTASVLMTQAFHKFAFPVDTHIKRCAKRWGLTCSQDVKQIEKDLKRLFPKQLWHKLHLQMIFFARTYCPARAHQIAACPLCRETSRSIS